MEIWSIAHFDLRVPDEEIGRLNLAEYEALIERKRAQDNKDRLNFGYVCSVILNSAPFADPDRKPVSPLDFVPDWKPKETVEKKAEVDLRSLTPEQQKNYFFNLFMKRTLRCK